MESQRVDYYGKFKSLDDWIETIQVKFSTLSLINIEKKIAEVLNVSDESEIIKIREASIVAYGRQHNVLTFEDACNKLKITSQIPNDIGIRIENIARYKLSIICEVLNDGWVPNWNDSAQFKYFHWFNMNGGFSYYATYYHYTIASVPSALYLKTKDMSYYMGNHYLSLYKDFLG